MARWKFKGCPRCGGDLYLDFDEGQPADHCLQCGYLDSNRNSDWTLPRSETQLPEASRIAAEKDSVSVPA